MNKENLLSFKTQVDKKDLEAFSQALMEQVVKLQVENQQLKEKVEHLETLLTNTPTTKTESGIIIPEGFAVGGISRAFNKQT